MSTSLWNILHKKILLIVLVGILSALLVSVLMIEIAPHYKVRMDFLIVQNTQTADFYALFKSSEFLGKVLGDAVYTDQFIDAVLATPAHNILHLPSNKQKRLVEWDKIVSVSNGGDLGRLSINVTHDDALVAQQAARSISNVLMTKNALFRGGTVDSIDVRLLTGPILQNNPSINQIIVVAIMGFLAGVIYMIIFIYRKSLRNINSNIQITAPLYNTQKDQEELHLLRTQQWKSSMNNFAQQLKRSQEND